MFNIGSGEMLLLFVVALMIFGPHRLPEIGRSVGEAMSSFKKAMQSLSEPLMAEVQTQSRQIREAAQPVPPASTTSPPALPERTGNTPAATRVTPPTEASAESALSETVPPGISTASALLAAAEAAQAAQASAGASPTVEAAQTGPVEIALARAEDFEFPPATPVEVAAPVEPEEEHVPVPMKPPEAP